MPSICFTYTSFSYLLVLQAFTCFLRSNQYWMSWMNWKYLYADFQDNYWIALKRHDLLSDRIYQGYTMYIPCIHQTYTMRRSLASQYSCPSAL